MKLVNEFLAILNNILSSPATINKAIVSRESVKIYINSPSKKKEGGRAIRHHTIASLSDVEAYGAFMASGELTAIDAPLGIEITVDISRINSLLAPYGLDSLSLREKIILEAAISSAHAQLEKIHQKKLNWLVLEMTNLEMPPARMEALEAEFNLLKAYLKKQVVSRTMKKIGKRLKFENPLSYDLLPAARQDLAGGMFQFKPSNVFISAGPSLGQYAEQPLLDFLDNLRFNRIRQVFAVGRVTPYHPQDGFADGRPIEKHLFLKPDFINYFIPDAHGKVTLPDHPDLAGIEISSLPLRKVGRITTYQIRINQGNPVFVHHYPLRDKQPLELTQEELAYIQSIDDKTPKDQSILTHCRGGKGRSAQMAYILAARHKPYSEQIDKQRLALMRLHKTGHANSQDFVETPFQADYLYALEEDLHQKNDFQEHPDFDAYQIQALLIREEIARFEKDDLIKGLMTEGMINTTSVIEKRAADYIQLIELYNEFLNSSTSTQSKVIAKIRALPSVSPEFKAIINSRDRYLGTLLQEFKEGVNPQQLDYLLDLTVKYKSYDEIILKLYEWLQTEGGREQRHLLRNKYKAAIIHACLRKDDQFKDNTASISIRNNLTSILETIEDNIKNAITQNMLDSHWPELKSTFVICQQSVLRYQSLFTNDKADKKMEHRLLKLQQIFAVDNPADLTITNESLCTPLQKELMLIIDAVNPASLNNNLDAYKRMLFGKVEGWYYKQVNYEEHSEVTRALVQALGVILNSDYEDPNAVRDAVKAVVLDHLATLSKKSLPSSELALSEETMQSQHGSGKSEMAEQQPVIKGMINAVRAGKKRELEQEVELKKESRSKPGILPSTPQKPKVLIFDVDDTLIDLDKGNFRQKEMLFAALAYAKLHGIEIAVCTARTPGLDSDPVSNGGYTLERLYSEIKKELDIDINLRFSLQDSIRRGQEALAAAHPDLIEGKNYLLDEIRLHYQVLNYADRLEHAANEAARATLLRVKSTSSEAWQTVIDQVLETQTRLLSGNKSPSFLTILRDQVFSSKNKEELLDELPHIEDAISQAIISSRRQSEQDRAAFLPEESECVFVDDHAANCDYAKKQGYRTVHAARDDTQGAYMVELYYQLGAYNGLIEKLNHPEKRLNVNAIPQFTATGFSHTPLIRHVKLSTFHQNIAKLDGKNAPEYIRQFNQEALRQYEQLPKEYKDDIAVTLYQSMVDEIHAIEQALINSAPGSDLQTWWNIQMAKLDELRLLQSAYSDKLGRNYLKYDLLKLNAILNNGEKFSVSHGQLKLDPARDAKLFQDLASIALHSLQKPHAAILDGVDGFGARREYFVKAMCEAITSRLQGNEQTYRQAFSASNLPDLLKFEEIAEFDADFDFNAEYAPADFVKKHQAWQTAIQLLTHIEQQMVPYMELQASLLAIPPADYRNTIQHLQKKAADLVEKLAASDQYKAMQFLTQAENYLMQHKWQVGAQWHETTLTDGTKVPKTVKAQLDVIAAARNNGDYVQAKQQFIQIGRDKNNSFSSARSLYSFFSCDESKKYFQQFTQDASESEAQLEERLSDVFSR